VWADPNRDLLQGEVITMMYRNDGWPGWLSWLVTVLSMAAFWGLLALGRSLTRPHRRPVPDRGTSAAPEELLAERFARDEIDEEDYLHRVGVLREQRPCAG
jgi:putative membrane protein